MSKSLSQTLRGTNYGTLPITAGGTGATSAAAALAALGAQATLSAASGSANGYLTSADWTTFNSKLGSYTLPTAGVSTLGGIKVGTGLTIDVNGIVTTTNSGTVTSVVGTTPIVSSGGATPAISIAAATTSVSGYLTSTDWTTFNSKQAALGTASTSVSGILSSTDWTTFNNKQAALSNASASVSGILTSTDWSTFNGKQAALVSGTNIKTVNGTTLLGTGDLVITGGASATKTIANKTAAYTVVAGDLGTIINCTANSFTVSLTAAATLGSGFTCTIWNTSNTATNAITIDPNLTETIDGKATLILRIGEGLNIICDGTNWQIDNKKPMRGYAENIDSASNAIAMGNGAVAIGVSYVSASASLAAGIFNNTNSYGAQTVSSVVIGYQARCLGNFSGTFGYLASGNGMFSTAIGYKAYTTGEKAMAFGQSKAAECGKITFGPHTPFSTVGDLQTGSIILSASTTTTTTVLMASVNAGLAANYNQLIVATDQAMTFFGTLIAKQSASNNMASYKVSGAISNNAGTMALADVTVEKIVDTIGLTTEPTFTADSTNKALAVTSGAKATTNIRWVMNIDSVEVTYA